MTATRTAARRRSPASAAVAVVAALSVWSILSSCQSRDRAGDERRQEQARLEQLRDSLWPALLQATGTAAKPAPPLVIVERADAERLIAVAVAEQYRAGELADLETAYRALGLLKPNDSLLAQMRRALNGQVLGLYDPAGRRMVLVRDGALLDSRQRPSALARLILAHELVHAAQDGQIDLRAFPKDRRNLDRQLATQAALEGHAVWASLRVLFPDADDGAMAPAILAALTQAVDTGTVWREVPPIIRESVIFPYRAGTAYLARVAAGAAPWRLPRPTATQDVLWEDRDGSPRPAAASPRWPALPADTRASNSLGVFGVLQLAAVRTPIDSADARRFRRGWRGDRWRLRDAVDGPMVTWESCWDAQETATRLLHRLEGAPTLRPPTSPAIAPAGTAPCGATMTLHFQAPPAP